MTVPNAYVVVRGRKVGIRFNMLRLLKLAMSTIPAERRPPTQVGATACNTVSRHLGYIRTHVVRLVLPVMTCTLGPPSVHELLVPRP